MSSVEKLYDAIVALDNRFERKGKTMPYTSVNGHMFSFVGSDGVVGLRLPPETRQAFMEQYQVEQPVQHNAVMKEYVVVPVSLLANPKKALAYFQDAYEYVSNLKPKK